MDLRLHLAVLWRFRFLVLGGLILAVALAFFSYFRVDLSNGTLGYRTQETWQSTETVLVTQKTSPLFSTNPSRGGPNSSPDWLLSLPALYAELASSAVINDHLKPELDALHGSYVASQDFASSSEGGGALPFLTFYASAPSQASSVKLAQASTRTFLNYVSQNQASQQIPNSQRVLLQVITPATASAAQVIAGRKKTIPIIVFLAVLMATVGLAYVLENLRPAIRQDLASSSEAPSVQPYSVQQAAAGGTRSEISRSRI
jgi:hypothetical protein